MLWGQFHGISTIDADQDGPFVASLLNIVISHLDP